MAVQILKMENNWKEGNEITTSPITNRGIKPLPLGMGI